MAKGKQKMGSGSGYGSPTSAQKRMGGFARKATTKFTSGNVKLTSTPQKGAAMPSKRKLSGMSY